MTYPCTECIIDHIAAGGPQDRADLQRECRTQAVPYTESAFSNAIDKLVAAGKIVLDPNDGDPYFDFPESYYAGLSSAA